MAARIALLLVVAFVGSLCDVDAHSFLVKPVARDQTYHTDTTNTVGCPTKKKGNVTSFRAGEEIDVRYWRNNHIGGFIRWSLAPSGDESHAAFDKHAFFYTCRESGPDCTPKKNADRPITGDSSPSNTISCGDTITLPDWLPAGDYVLQWTWFGVGHSNGNLGWAEPQFRSCADIKLMTAGTKAAAPKCPTFVGGDRVTRAQNKTSDQCFYFYTTSIVSEWYQGSNDESIALPLYKYGKPAAVTSCSGGGGNATDNGDAAGKDAELSPPPPTASPTAKPETTPTPSPPQPSTKTPTSTKTPIPTATSASCRRKE
jgi:hypothetical protein